MSISRRTLIQSSVLLAASSLVNPLVAAERPKRLLILGGTGFIGPHTVRTAVERGHEVSIFTRGRRSADLPDSVEHLIGDRNDDLSALEGRRWDAVLDNNCYDYRWAERSTELLRDATDHYLLVSSISAYAQDATQRDPGQILTSPLPLDAPRAPIPTGWEHGTEADYALMKRLSEDAVMTVFPDRHTIVRPTLIVGPGDHTGRWSYWPNRFQRGGEILAPGNPQHAVQIIDQRDLTEWHVHLVEAGITGQFNGAGPAERLSMNHMLDQIGKAVENDWRLTWVAEDFLSAQGIQPWSDMPVWVPNNPMTWTAVDASVAAGLRFRPITTTARDTLTAEANGVPPDDRRRPFSLTPEREQAALQAWHEHQGSG